MRLKNVAVFLTPLTYNKPLLLLPKLQVVIINPVPRNRAANNSFKGSSKIYILDSDLVWQIQLILIKG